MLTAADCFDLETTALAELFEGTDFDLGGQLDV